MQNTSRRAFFITLSISVLFFSMIALACSGCILDERRARQYTENGVKIESNLPISSSSPMIAVEVETIKKQVLEGLSLDELKSKVASFDKDLVIIKDVFGKADMEYGKVLKLSGAPDWVPYAQNLIRLHKIVIEIDEKVLTMFHSYISSVEAGAPVDFQNMVSQCATDISPQVTEFTKISQDVSDDMKQPNDK